MGLSAYGKDKYLNYFNDLIGYDQKILRQKKYLITTVLIIRKIILLNSIKIFYQKNQLVSFLKSLKILLNHYKVVLKILLCKLSIDLKKVSSKNLVMAGGCAMNGLVNGRIFKESNFKNHFIQPASTDDGTALELYYCWHNYLKKKDRFIMKHAFWGPIYNEKLY